ncbi:hypothetical protein HII13_004467 [Brettanomyces bruxellensis]|nr:hypothetical protein HII13_004467 [Brettanomyces bruxellensis]
MAITRIDQTDVHQITSGQVIVDLTTAVKEVVENGLDAKATQIDITFKNYGKDSIVVTDNGSGIEEQDFESICLKHYTSKLSSFSDVETVSTFGFRGEAMSSLCAISDVIITTATAKTTPQAWCVEFNQMGRISSKKMASRPIGTTVEISKLFERLPVRRIDLVKNIKREYHKAIAFLQCYALVSTGVRMIVRHIDARGRKSVVFSTSGSKELKRNITSLFGSGGAHGLEAVDFTVSVPANFHQGVQEIRFSGFISNASFGQGRSSSDRQFWYINGRPVHLPRFSKAVNETYKKFNHLQYPMIVLVLFMDQKFVDINVTPDKRTVMVSNETKILESLRVKLDDIFSSNDVRIPVNDNVTERISERNNSVRQFTLESFSLKSDDTSSIPNTDKDDEISDSKDETEREKDENESRKGENELVKVQEEPEEVRNEHEMVQDEHELVQDEPEKIEDEPEKVQNKYEKIEYDPEREVEEFSTIADDNIKETSSFEKEKVQSTYSQSTSPILSPTIEVSRQESLPDFKLESSPIRTNMSRNDIIDSTQKKVEKVCFTTFGREREIDSSKFDMKLRFLKRMRLVEQESSSKRQRLDDITDTNNAEKLLTLTVTKSDFMEMKIIGQFNLGFILVTRKNRNTGSVDMFIVDQHASDEKYNFERLQRDTKFQSQPLVVPQVLELNAVDEMIVSNNVDLFEKNGFKIRVKDDESTGRKIELLALPFSKNTQFNLMDFYELINMVREDEGNSSLRPTKVRSMFAMRACRSSIMIGRALKRSTMTKVIRHLSGLDKPWNCPHGRPTMRHLVELHGWSTFKKDCY